MGNELCEKNILELVQVCSKLSLKNLMGQDLGEKRKWETNCVKNENGKRNV